MALFFFYCGHFSIAAPRNRKRGAAIKALLYGPQRKKKSESRSAWKSKAGSSRVATKCANQYKSQHIVWINNLTLRKWTSFALF